MGGGGPYGISVIEMVVATGWPLGATGEARAACKQLFWSAIVPKAMTGSIKREDSGCFELLEWRRA
jgi:hypothetical protein